MPMTRCSSRPALSAIAAVALGLGGLLAQGVASAQTPAAASSSRVAHADSSFMKNAAESSLAEIDVGNLALQKGSSAAVKSFAQKMIDDHKKASTELQALAGSKDVKLPSEATMVDKGKAKILEKRDGTGFDHAYAENQVSAHKDAVKLFEKASKDAKDADVKAWAAKTLPTLQHHLQEAQSLEATTKAADKKK
jgi:putative membrane protein